MLVHLRRLIAACVLLPTLVLAAAKPDDGVAGDALARWEPFKAARAHTVTGGHQGRAVRHTVSVTEDARGRIWIGDYAGITRLDGDVQRRYDGGDIPQMAEGYTHAFLPLPDGDLLVGGDREGVLRYDHRSDRFIPVVLPNGERLTRINSLSAGSKGDVWVASEQGLYRWKPGRDQLLHELPVGLDDAASKRVFDVQYMPDGSMWLAAQPGLYHRAAGQAQWQPVTLGDARLQQRLRGESAWTLELDDQGRLWVGMMQSGVVVFDAKGHAFAPDGLDGNEGLHQGRTIRTLLWDPLQQHMLVGTDGHGLLTVKGHQTRRLPVNLSEFTGGRNFHVRDLLRARNGRIWVASDRGVFHMPASHGWVVELDASQPGKDPYEAVFTTRSSLVDTRGRLWLGQSGGIIQVLDPATGKRSVVQLPAPLTGTHVTAMVSDGHGRIWVTGNGVAWVDEQTLQARLAGPIGHAPVRRYVGAASDGQHIWLTHNEGLVEVDRQGNVLRRMDDALRGLQSTRLNAVAHHAGKLYVGSAEGLHVVDLANWQAQLLPVAGLAPDQSMFRATSSLLVNDDGVWTGTLQGIAQARPGESSLGLILPTDGEEIRGLIEDGHGGIWFAQNGKPSRIGRISASGDVSLVQTRHGLHSGTVLQMRALSRTSDGVLVASTETGALLVDPAVFDESTLAIPDLSPRLLEAAVNGVDLPLDQLPSGDSPLQLAHDVERVSVTFSALDFIGQQLRQYSFRLDGMDTRWINANGGTPRVFYSRLPAGKYTLMLRTTSSEYPGREWITRIPVEVAPVWYQNPWNWALMALATVLLVIGLVQLRLAHVRRLQAHLRRLVDARTEQLQQANERLARLASEDALTGLDSRRRGIEKLSALVARRRRQPGQDVVMLIDLDYFKQINDTYGHLAGDEVLREVARRLRRELREVDAAIRYGGEELLVVLPDTNVEGASIVAERLAAALRDEPVRHEGTAIRVTASFGLALLLPAAGIENSLARADEALYQAKSDGRDCVRFADHTTDAG